MNTEKLLIVFITLLHSNSALNLHYDSTKHFYDDLLISISPDVPETDSSKTINNIKQWLTEGSKSLYSASQGWAHFRNVYILVPASWSPVPGAQPAHEVHEDAQIRVEPTHTIYGDSPFTLQTGECGEEGEYIQITQNYLNENVNTTDSVFGPSGQVFLYEWSKFRYGVFEEHGYPGDPLYPMFYSKQIFTANGPSNVVKPNFCTNEETTGIMQNMNGDTCSMKADGMPADDCLFIVDGPSSLESSVMSVPYFAGNDQWCDLTEERIHHSDIPTKHNTMCDGQSVFEVVRQSWDFEGYKPLNRSVDTTPKFTILQPTTMATPFMFILDASNSMARKNNRIGRLKQGIERFMTYDVDLSLGLPYGVASFSSVAESRIDHEIIPINDTKSRDEIINTVLGLNLHGDTCLHTGIRKGLEALRSFGQETGGAAIFLTDGGQYCDPVKDWLKEIIDEVLAQDVRFCTIAFSDNADPNLEELAKQTNGAAYFVPDNSGPEYVNNALQSCLAFLPSGPSKDQEVALFQKTYEDQKKVEEMLTFDQFSARDLSIQVDYDVEGEFELTFEGHTSNLKGNGVEIIRPDTLMPGSYPITVKPKTKASNIKFLTILVKAKAEEDMEPLTTDCWTNAGQNDVNMQGNDPDKLVIYGKAMQGSSPVIDADMRAYITAGAEDELVLRDDGAAPDSIKNDGIYSAYYIPSSQRSRAETRYSLSCKVLGTNQTTVVNMTNSYGGKSLPSHPSSSSPLCCGSVAVKDDTPKSPTGVFTRSKSGGVITIKGNTGNNIYPPAPIRDLVLTDNIFKDNFNLSFTTPGEDLNSGKISEYIIFYSENRTVLEDLSPSNPTNLTMVTEEMLDCNNCTMDPLPALSKVMLKINSTYFEKDVPYNFRVLAVDKGDKTSVSNIVGYVANPTLQMNSGLSWHGNLSLILGAVLILKFFIY